MVGLRVRQMWIEIIGVFGFEFIWRHRGIHDARMASDAGCWHLLVWLDDRRHTSKQAALVERWQVGYWTTALRCTEGELLEAVAAVGLAVVEVCRYLAKRA